MLDTTFARSIRATTVALALSALLAGPVVSQESTLTPAPQTPAPTSAEPTASTPPLVLAPGTSWLVRSYDAGAADLVEPRRNTTLTVELLIDGRLQGETGCGTYLGGYLLDAAVIDLSVIAKGPSGCGRRRSEEAVAFITALESATRWAATPSGVSLLDDEGRSRVALEAWSRPGLAGAWAVTAMAAPDGTLKPVPSDLRVSIAFDAADGISGSSGCRLYTGQYASETDQVLVIPIDTTGFPCEGEQKATEERFFETLEGVILWQRSGDELRLTDSQGTVLIELAATRG